MSHAQWVSWVGGFLMREDTVLIVEISKTQTLKVILTPIFVEAALTAKQNTQRYILY